MTRVLIADDHAAIRAGLRLLLETSADIEVVGEATDGDQATTLTTALRPEVVLMDIRMPGTDGIEATARICATGISKVLILTTFDIDDYIFTALRAGASGFMLKTADASELIAAVSAVARGDAALAPEVTRRVIDRFTHRSGAVAPADPGESQRRDLSELTERERQVLSTLGAGLSNAQIASALFIGETTVKTHVSRVLNKLDLQSRVQAAIVAREHGLTYRPGHADQSRRPD
ncbi:response regulator [Williamsia soli]|uniref:response regulator n=1 Tax=Williamsia soli TaxID=364929 RepID=UPI001A9E15F0|nr:response regulator transcription factor [Williamsia soli]